MNRKQRLLYNILNALIISLIAFVSSLPFRPPTSIADVYPALITFVLSFLIQLKNLIEPNPKSKPKQRESKNPDDSNQNKDDDKPLLLSII